MSCDVSFALGDLSTNRAIPRLVLIFPHHATDPRLKYF